MSKGLNLRGEALDLRWTFLHSAEVAHALGFADQAHLTREFKKVHHITPGGYRRLLKAGRSVPA